MSGICCGFVCDTPNMAEKATDQTTSTNGHFFCYNVMLLTLEMIFAVVVAVVVKL